MHPVVYMGDATFLAFVCGNLAVDEKGQQQGDKIEERGCRRNMKKMNTYIQSTFKTTDGKKEKKKTNFTILFFLLLLIILTNILIKEKINEGVKKTKKVIYIYTYSSWFIPVIYWNWIVDVQHSVRNSIAFVLTKKEEKRFNEIKCKKKKKTKSWLNGIHNYIFQIVMDNVFYCLLKKKKFNLKK